MRRKMKILLLLIHTVAVLSQQQQKGVGCVFSDEDQVNGEKQVRVSEDTPTGTQIFVIKAFPRRLFAIQSLDGSRTDGFFTFEEIDHRHVGIVLARSLQDLTDQSSPVSDIRFRLACRGRDQETSYLPVTIFIQDINDHPPVFQADGYNVTIEENTPVGLTVFRGIHAIDRDQPNTPNSFISYSILSGNEDKKFSLEGSGKAVLVLRKKLDFEQGDTFFNLTVVAEDAGVPPLSSTSSLLITVRDVDDRNPIFSKSLYKLQIKEDYPLTGTTELRLLETTPPIYAEDQDTSIKAELQYGITGGNEMKYFHIDKDSGQLYLTRELDREQLESGKFFLDISAWQKDNEVKAATSAVEIDVLDVNDNKPEFQVEKYNMTVIENLPAGFRIMQFTATDRDQPENSVFHYALEDPSGAFLLDSEGSLILEKPDLFDREKYENIVVRVLAIEDSPSVLPNSEPFSVEVDIHLLDYNDNSPVFLPNNVYLFLVPVGAQVGAKVGQVQAEDLDQGTNGYIKYKIRNSTESLPISLDPLSGEIFLTQLFTQSRKLSFFVEAVDLPENEEERKSAVAVVELQWPDNDDIPGFQGTPYEWWLDTEGEFEEGMYLGTVRTMNLDPTSIRYAIKHNYNSEVPFDIDAETGVVTVSGLENQDWKSSYNLDIFVTDSESEISTPLIVRLGKGEADFGKEQEIPKMLDFSVLENAESLLVANLSYLLSDRKKSTERLITNDDGKDKFYLTDGGLLYTSGPLDRETRDTYMFTVLVGRRGLPRGFRSQQAIQVKVKVEDVNDNNPVFEQHIYQGHIPDNSEVGTEVLLAKKIIATDADILDAKGVKIEIYGKDSEKFRFDAGTGGVFLSDGVLSRSTKEVYYLRLRATDSAGQVGEGQLVIHVTDRKNHQPKFLKLQVLDSRLVSVAKDKVWVGDGVGAPVLDMAETVPPGTRIARVLAEDPDTTRNNGLVYSLVSEEATHMEARKNLPAKDRFYVEETSGDILVKRQVEAKTSYILNISAQDEGGLSTITQIILRVNDINNNKPVFDKNEYIFKVLEGEYSGVDVGTVLAEDEDFFENGEITYSIVDPVEPADGAIFTLETKSGAITVSGVLDRENIQTYHLLVAATDHGERQLTSQVNVTVLVLDVNDNQPIFYGYDRLMEEGGFHTIPVYTTKLQEVFISPGIQVAQILANDTDDISTGNGIVEFKLLDNSQRFYIDPKSGVVTTLVRIGENSTITVEAADNGTPSKSATALIHIILSEEKPIQLEQTKTFSDERPNLPEIPRSIPDTVQSIQNISRSREKQAGNRGKIDSIEEELQENGKDKKKYGSMFKQEVYTVQVMENVDTPLVILPLGQELVQEVAGVSFRIVGSNYGIFRIEENSGELSIISSPDREQRDTYILRIKAALNDSSKKVPLFFYTLFIEGDEDGVGEGEVIVRINIMDENDNPPEFLLPEFHAAVQSSAEYGDPVFILQAWDKDVGENSELVYTLENTMDRFTVNYNSGQVVSTAKFNTESGTIYRVLAKVEDKGGRQGSLSSTAQLVVSVLNPDLEVHLLLDQPQHLVEANLQNITSVLSNLSSTLVSSSGVRPSGLMTEVRFYGIDGDALVPGEQLRNKLSLQALEHMGVREIVLGKEERSSGLGSVEVAVLTIACLVFLGAFIAVLCICCIKLRRSQKHYPAPLAIPLPNYSFDQGGKDMMERETSQRFGTIPRVSTIQDRTRSDRISTRAHSERGRDKEARSVHIESSEDDAYLAKSSLQPRGAERRSQHSRHSGSSHRKSVRSVHEVKSSGESSRSRDSGIDDNRDCCSCRQSSVSSRESSYAPPHCNRCCGCPAQITRRHRSSSPTRRSCSLRPRCSSHRSVPRHAHSHHDLRPETDTESESDSSHLRGDRVGSGRRTLYTAELWSRSLTPSQSEARLSQAELRLASTTANRGHSWRGEIRPILHIDKKFQFSDRHQSSGHIHGDKSNKETSIRTSSRKSNLKPPRTS